MASNWFNLQIVREYN